MLRQVVVTAADVDDREGLKQVLTRLKATGVARLRKLWADGLPRRGHPNVGGQPKKDAKIDLVGGFTVLKRRWVVEYVGMVDEFSPTCPRL